MTDFVDSALDTLVVPGFSRIGYKVRSRDWDPIDEDLTGRTMVVTGATSGLGRAAAEELAGLGARVILVARDEEKAEKARTDIMLATGNEEVAIQLADLSLMSEVRSLAARLLDTESAIHVLINNVGALFNERKETAEGIEMTLATNLAGQFLLTRLLLDRLKESAPSRIIFVSSGGMYTQRISVTNLQNDQGEYKGAAAYARTKRGQVIITEMLAERLQGTGVVVHSMHPGWADTPGVSGSLPLFRKLTGPFLRSAEEGADTMVWLAADPEPTKTSGLFWHDREPRETHKTDRTRALPEKREELWKALEDLTGI